jgi:hypothetical protein
VTLIAAGSVWKLQFKTADTAGRARDRLRDLARDGVGERLSEGAGAFVVDPPWLQRPSPLTIATTKTVDALPSAARWPGVEQVDPARLSGIVASLPTEKQVMAVRAPLQTLLQAARQGTPPGHVLGIADEMAARKNPRQWAGLKRGMPARVVLDGSAGDGEEFAFALTALLIRASAQREEEER